MIGQHAPTSQEVAFARTINALSARLADLERLASVPTWPLISASDTYTPSHSGITIGTGGSAGHTATYRWIGGPNSGDIGVLDVWGSITLGNTGASVTSPALVSLPSGFQIPAGIDVIASQCRFVNPGDNGYPGYVRRSSATAVQFFAWPASGSFAFDDDVSSVVPFTWGAGDRFDFHFHVPAART